MAEVEGTDAESHEMLDDGVVRIGHGTFIGATVHERVAKSRIPIGSRVLQSARRACWLTEPRQTSNIKCATVPDVQQHRFSEWYHGGHPVVLCVCTTLFFLLISSFFVLCAHVFAQTDDKGVFLADLSDEYALAASTFGLSRKQLFELSLASIDCTLADEPTKRALRDAWEASRPALMGS